MPPKTPKPYPAEAQQALTLLGNHLREARLRRELSIEAIANQLGVSRRVIADAEHGKATTSIGVYAGMLWAMGLVNQLDELAIPDREPAEEFALETGRKRAPRNLQRSPSKAPDKDVPF
ncbi:MAG: helix-turn-helix domain-containing protein [Myxococcales bacterium]